MRIWWLSALKIFWHYSRKTSLQEKPPTNLQKQRWVLVEQTFSLQLLWASRLAFVVPDGFVRCRVVAENAGYVFNFGNAKLEKNILVSSFSELLWRLTDCAKSFFRFSDFSFRNLSTLLMVTSRIYEQNWLLIYIFMHFLEVVYTKDEKLANDLELLWRKLSASTWNYFLKTISVKLSKIRFISHEKLQGTQISVNHC